MSWVPGTLTEPRRLGVPASLNPPDCSVHPIPALCVPLLGDQISVIGSPPRSRAEPLCGGGPVRADPPLVPSVTCSWVFVLVRVR